MIIDKIAGQPIIEASRFVLRPLRKSDAGLIELYASDERLARATRSIPHPLPPGSTMAYVERSMADDRKEDVWAIDGAAHGLSEVMGVIGLTPLEQDQSEVGYWVAPALWNSGIASEAVQAIVARNPHGARTLFAEVFQDNPASARVLTNAGFDYIGDAEAFCVARNARVKTWTYVRKMT